ncbi:glycosyltransferase [Pseudoxanthobacter sp. M-2]|uniref:glycosyltransferase n=1 Tax=Pseudoxanthobacter sp. M-2 TaxID=3078754 RepID=UPI0038FD1AAB
MLAQLIDVLLGEVAPALGGAAEPEEAEAFVATALMKVAGASPTAGRRVTDADLPPELAARLALMPGLTGGGRRAVAEAPTLYESISRLFSDKGFRALLRERAGKTGRLSPVNRMISLASDMPMAVAQQAEALQRSVVKASERPPAAWQPQAVARKGGAAVAGRPAEPMVRVIRGGVNGARRATAAAAEAGRLRGRTAELPAAKDLPKGIAAQLSDRFPYKARGQTVVTTVADFVAALADPAEPGITRAAMTGFVASGRGLMLCLLHRLTEAGTLPVDPRLSPDLAMTAVRVYTNNNAAETAYRVARTLRDGPLHAQLPEGEQRRLTNLIARAALRSGRVEEAARLYRETFLLHPDGADAIVNYFTSIFGTEPEAAVSIGKAILSNGIQVAQNDLVFIGDVLLSRGCLDEAEAAFLRVLRDEPTYADGFLGLANVAAVRGRPALWWGALQRFGQLSGLRLDGGDGAAAIGHPFALTATTEQSRDGPLVTVVTTCFNGAETLEASATSVLAQSAGNLELFIVDDVSTDGSRALIEALAARDERVKPIFNTRNMGTYASKNQAIAAASGAFVTFHDSDDWMHPDRIATHVAAMQGGVACTASQWIRMDLAGRSIVRRGGPYLHLNPASTFIRREVFEAIGPFDTVRTGADSEILSRIRNHYGRDSAPTLTTCLGVGLHSETSLTQSGATAFDEYRYSPVRLAYTEAWLAWHLERLEKGLPIALKDGGRRPFKVPDVIRS